MTARRRVLVIEDDTDGRQGLVALLESWGHSALPAATGSAGLALALREVPDVIIVDLCLGDLDGCDVIRRIRADACGATPVILAYSGYHRREDEALAAGCDVFVLKPAVEELEALLHGTREGARRRAKEHGRALERHRGKGAA